MFLYLQDGIHVVNAINTTYISEILTAVYTIKIVIFSIVFFTVCLTKLNSFLSLLLNNSSSLSIGGDTE